MGVTYFPFLRWGALAAFVTISTCSVTKVDVSDSVIVFDAAAFQTSSGDLQWVAPLRSYVYERQLNVTPVLEAIEAAMDEVGLEVGDDLPTLEERIQLFGATPLAEKEVDVKVSGCVELSPIVLEATSSNESSIGMMEQNKTLGVCESYQENGWLGNVLLEQNDTREVNFTVFASEPKGWGIISDIDDSIKNTYVLDTVKLLQATLLDAPDPVSGMPKVFSELDQALKNPQVIYLSGSPFQLYPMLHSFIESYYPRGPILLQNLTYTGVSSVLAGGSEPVLDFKVGYIDKIHGWYPEKNFLALGDSTQSDPEVYGTVYPKYGGDFIKCIWIRLVDGGNNTDARFSTAFEGVPSHKYRTFTNASELLDVNVAGGEC